MPSGLGKVDQGKNSRVRAHVFFLFLSRLHLFLHCLLVQTFFPPERLLIHISEPGYQRPRRACQTCAAHIAAGEYSCNARYALAIATPGADMYHKQAAVRHLSAAMEDAAKNAVKSGGGWGGGDGGGGGVLGPLSAIQRVHGGTPAVFEALVPMMSTEV